MGNSSGKAMANYERNLAEWQAECEAMRVEEKRLARDNKPDDCRLCTYWCQNFFACLEIPLRMVWHLLMCGLTGLLVLCTCGQWSMMRVTFLFHWNMLSWYGFMPNILCSNMCEQPNAPFYVYERDVTLIRPERPTPPVINECCNCCSCKPKCGDPALCNCIFCGLMVQKFVRTSFFTLGHFHSCHGSTCCGPCCNCSMYESLDDRFDRWEHEYLAERSERTRRWREAYWKGEPKDYNARVPSKGVGAAVLNAMPKPGFVKRFGSKSNPNSVHADPPSVDTMDHSTLSDTPSTDAWSEDSSDSSSTPPRGAGKRR